MINNKDIKLSVILGSGLDVIIDSFEKKMLINEDEKGIHKKRTFIAEHDGKQVLIFCGRKHFYEGYSNEELLGDIHLAKEYGVNSIMITNAAGGLNLNFEEADLMLIRTFINLRGSMKLSEMQYKNGEFVSTIIKACRELKIKLHEGIYGYLPGPVYETPAEIRMLRKFNIDAVGMSTVPEINEAAGLGMNAVGVSVITNLLKESACIPADHNKVLETARMASPALRRLILGLLNELN